MYTTFTLPSGASRGGHAHKELQQLVIALSGSFDVTIDDGVAKQRFSLNRPQLGLYIGPFLWRELDNFSSNAVCLVLASMPYDENDYFRTYDSFVRGLERRT